MAKVAIIGAGFAGQTAALYLGDALGAEHEITVINRLKDFSYVPSWVWVGIGRMPVEKTTFPLGPVYERFGVRFVHGRATESRPARDSTSKVPKGSVRRTASASPSARVRTPCAPAIGIWKKSSA
jgi:NADPH-dependent 2,4-dienoyl-CoA reductase/sulfur reductase-like enzyme